MDAALLREFSSELFVTSLDRKALQTAAKELGVKASGKTDDLVQRIMLEARRRIALPADALDDESYVDLASTSEALPQPSFASSSFGRRLQRGLGSIRTMTDTLRSKASSNAPPAGSAAMEKDPLADFAVSRADGQPSSLRMIAPRTPRSRRPSLPSGDSAYRELYGDVAATSPHTPLAAPASPVPPLPAFPAELRTQPAVFVFGSPAQPPRSNAEFAATTQAFAKPDFGKAAEAVKRELEARTGRRVSAGEPVGEAEMGTLPLRIAPAKQSGQQALGHRYDSAHQKEFSKMDSIAHHPSVRRHASHNLINALAADDHDPTAPAASANVNGKRSASATSIQSLAAPAVKRLRAAVEPTAADNRIADGLKQEGWTGVPPPDVDELARRQEARRQLRVAEARRRSGRKSVGRTVPPPVSSSLQQQSKAGTSTTSRLLSKAAEGFRALAAQPAHPRLEAPPVVKTVTRQPSMPNLLFGQHTAQRAAVSTMTTATRKSVASVGAASGKGPGWKAFDLQASLSKGTKYRPKDTSTVYRDPPPLPRQPANEMTSTAPKADIFGSTTASVRPRIDRAQIQARAAARLEWDRLGDAVARRSPAKSVLQRSPAKQHSSPDKRGTPSKIRSSTQIKARAV